MVWHRSMVFHLVLRQCYIVNFFSYMSSWPRSMPCSTYHSAFALFRSCLGSHTHNFELTLKAWTIHSFSLFGSTTPLSTTPTSSLPPWASFILFNRARNNLKTNLKAAQTLAIVHPSLHNLTRPTLLYDLIANYQDPQHHYPDAYFSQSSALSPCTTTSSSHTLEISLSPSYDQILASQFHLTPCQAAQNECLTLRIVLCIFFHLFPAFSVHILFPSFPLALELVTSILHVEFHSSLTFWVVTTFASISGRFLTSWRVLLWNLLVLIHDVIIDAVLAPGIPDLILKKLIMVMTRPLPYLPSTHHPALKLHAAFQIHHHIPTPPRATLLTTTSPLPPHLPTLVLPSLLSLVHNPLQLFHPLHLHILPFHSSHHHASKHHAHDLHFLNHVPRAHRPSIHMHRDHVPGNLLPATIAHRERHVHHSHDTMIDVVLPGAALPTLADTVDIDTAHLQHHAPDGTTVTVAVHILGDAALAHTNESPFREHRRTTNLPPTRSRSCHSSHHRGSARADPPAPRSAPRATSHGTPVSPPASVHPPSDRDSLLPGPGDRPHPQPTPPDSASITTYHSTTGISTSTSSGYTTHCPPCF